MSKRIWLLNHYASKQFLGHGGRHYSFAKYLIRAGYQVTVFCANTVHGSDQLVSDEKKLYSEKECDGIPFVFVKARSYQGNKIKRVLNMMDFYHNVQKAAANFERPDVIVGSSVHPLTCVAAKKIADRFGCRFIAEIRDLWPESIVAYDIAGKKNPVIQALYILEKWIYTEADAIIFTMEGGRDYIIEKGWDTDHGGPVDLNKVHYINNGVDLELFEYNREHYAFPDPDLDDPNHFKVTYTGTIRKVNGVGQLVDVAEQLKKRGNAKIKILIYGEGDEREALEHKVAELGLDNIIFKGKVEKNVVPYVLSKSDACLLHWMPTPITKFGMSMNKSFEYLASGKPLISNVQPRYDLIAENQCGLSKNILSPEAYADLIEQMYETPKGLYEMYCKNSLNAAEIYDFKRLAEKLVGAIIGQ